MPSREGDKGASPSELTAAIHETTNALTVILGWLERARESSDGNTELLQALRHAAHHARNVRAEMRRLIGAELPEPPPADATETLKRITNDLMMEAERASVSLQQHCDDDCAGLHIPRPDIVWRVMTNLILNAIAFSKAEQNVTLTLTCDGTTAVRFCVTDEGPGVAAEQRAQLFASGRSGRPGGVGVGLRHAHELAAQHGGSLTLADSTGGAQFELRWPLSSSDVPPAPPSERPLNPQRLDGLRLLLLEDDAAVVELLELSLTARGGDINTVTAVDAMRTALGNHDYDVLLMDLSPLGDQRDAILDEICEGYPALNVILTSGSVTVVPRSDVRWLRKPFTPNELISTIWRDRHPPEPSNETNG